MNSSVGILKSPPRNEKTLRNFDFILPKFRFILPKFYFGPRWRIFGCSVEVPLGQQEKVTTRSDPAVTFRMF